MFQKTHNQIGKHGSGCFAGQNDQTLLIRNGSTHTQGSAATLRLGLIVRIIGPRTLYLRFNEGVATDLSTANLLSV